MHKNINQLIIKWYEENKRDLPWRKTKNPYLIWVSEIILQQTKIQQGTGYFNRFVERFGNIQSLAEADENDVLQIWQGLGYYSRARNMHKAAKFIFTDLKGVFPNTYKEIIQLPGVGDYTASAISSFAFQEKQAVLDGNVFRVLSRLFGISNPIDCSEGKKIFRKVAQEFLSNEQPDVHNQAIMEFGALQCVPKNPNCENCPILLHCEAHRTNSVENLPIKSKKNKTKDRFFHFVLFKSKNEVAISKRMDKDIWQHLYEFPLMETKLLEIGNPNEVLNPYFQTENLIFEKKSFVTHLLSHQKLFLTFYQVNLPSKIKINEAIWVNLNQISDFPFAKPMQDFIQDIEI